MSKGSGLPPPTGAQSRLQARLLNIVEASKLKSKTILCMRQEIEKLQATAQKANEEANHQQDQLERQLNEVEDEKEQVGNVYEQENKMRQELEVLVDQMTQDTSKDRAQIATLQSDLATTTARLEQEGIDRLKTE
jgi:hypothetical protein